MKPEQAIRAFKGLIRDFGHPVTNFFNSYRCIVLFASMPRVVLDSLRAFIEGRGTAAVGVREALDKFDVPSSQSKRDNKNSLNKYAHTHQHSAVITSVDQPSVILLALLRVSPTLRAALRAHVRTSASAFEPPAELALPSLKGAYWDTCDPGRGMDVSRVCVCVLNACAYQVH